MKKIPIALPFLGDEEAEAASKTIRSGWVTQGPRVEEFERKFASYVGSDYAVAVSNCTTALHLSMIVAGIGQGDEVICPSMSYVATANCIRYVGATPVFAEVGNDYNLDINDVKQRLNANTKAILLVHQIGMPADLDAFSKLCKERSLILIEDAACAIGSEYHGKKIGCHSDLVCFSFHPRKVITTGDGGMITTSNEKYQQRLRLLRQHAMSVNDRVRHSSSNILFEEHLELGYNYRLTDIQASVGIEQLKKLDWIVQERRKIARRYIDELCHINSIALPVENDQTLSNYQSFSIRLTDKCNLSRNQLMQKLLDVGISSRRGIMTAHREGAYQPNDVSLPVSEFLSDNSILLPLYSQMKKEDQYRVIKFLKEFLSD